MAKIQAIIGLIKDCSVEKLENIALMEGILEKAAKLMDLTLLKTVSHKFSPQGLTAIALLAESHIAIHTYPEENSIFVEVMSCCGRGDARKVLELMENMLGGKAEIVLEKVYLLSGDKGVRYELSGVSEGKHLKPDTYTKGGE